MKTLPRRHLLNLLLLTTVLGLVGLVLLEHRQSPEPTEQRLLPLAADAIMQLRIERPDQPPIELLRRDGQRWQLTSPLAIEANTFRVEALLRIANLNSHGSFAADPAQLAEYGLLPPQASLLINRQYRLEFGGQTALDHRRYVRLDDQIHTVADTLYYHLLGDWHGLVSHALLPEQARITALSLPSIDLRLEEGHWRSEPAGALPSPDQIQALLDAWQHPGVIQVRRYSGQPGQPIRLELADGTRLEWVLIEDKTALARPELGIQYQLSEAALGQLLALAE